MTDRSSSEHLSVVMTTESVDYVTVTAAVAGTVTSSARGIEFYFQCAVVIIGVVGLAANALILYAMVVSKQHKKQVLIFNQNVLDLFSCFFLAITNTVKLCDIYLTGSGGYWLCMLFLSDIFTWSTIMASKVNIVFVTIERYLKVVYPTWTKNKLRDWMIYTAMAFAWISGFVNAGTLVFITSVVIDGVCVIYIWQSPVAQLAYEIGYMIVYFVLVVMIFIFCYWRILIVIRRQASVMAGYSGGGPGPSTAQIQTNQMQNNVIKTMILVSVFYTISDLPVNLQFLLFSIQGTEQLTGVYYATWFISFLYFCANPFIYATKFEPVKRVLLQLIPCKKNAVQPIESIELATPRLPASNTLETRD